MYFYIFLYKSFFYNSLFKQADVISPCFFMIMFLGQCTKHQSRVYRSSAPCIALEARKTMFFSPLLKVV